MADLLLTFGGRIGRLGYLLSLICMAIAITIIFMIQRALGDWKFGSIFITASAMVPLIIYLTATSKRFQDRGRHPLLGFLFYYIIPAALIFGIERVLGDAFVAPENLAAQLSSVSTFDDIPQNVLMQLGAYALAGLLFVLGQISVFLRKGTPAENVFDEAEPLSVSI